MSFIKKATHSRSALQPKPGMTMSDFLDVLVRRKELTSKRTPEGEGLTLVNFLRSPSRAGMILDEEQESRIRDMLKHKNRGKHEEVVLETLLTPDDGSDVSLADFLGTDDKKAPGSPSSQPISMTGVMAYAVVRKEAPPERASGMSLIDMLRESPDKPASRPPLSPHSSAASAPATPHTPAAAASPDTKRSGSARPAQRTSNAGQGERKTVIIVGASLTGCTIASQLNEDKEHWKVILVDARGYLEHSPGVVRALCHGVRSEKYIIPLEQIVPKAEIHVAEVVTVEPGRVLLSNTKALQYDYIVVAVGSQYDSSAISHEAHTEEPLNSGNVIQMFDQILQELCERNFAGEIIAYVDDLDEWLHLRITLKNLLIAREKLDKAMLQTKLSIDQGASILREIKEETAKKEQQIKEELIFLRKNYIASDSEYQINISAKLRSTLDVAIQELKNIDEIEELLVKSRNTLIHTIQDRLTEFKTYSQKRSLFNVFYRRDANDAEESEKLKLAESVCIIGNGALAVHFAAELIQTYPNKRIRLISSHSKLFPVFPDEVSQHAQNFLTGQGLQISLNENVTRIIEGINAVSGNDEAKVVLKGGITIKVDRYYIVGGSKSSTDYMNKHYASAIESRGRLKVNDTLQLVAQPNIFVVGNAAKIARALRLDLTSASVAVAENVIKNLNRHAAGKKLSKPKVELEQMNISLGHATRIIASGMNFELEHNAPLEEDPFRILNPSAWEAKESARAEVNEKDKKRGMTLTELLLAESNNVGTQKGDDDDHGMTLADILKEIEQERLELVKAENAVKRQKRMLERAESMSKLRGMIPQQDFSPPPDTIGLDASSATPAIVTNPDTDDEDEEAARREIEEARKRVSVRMDEDDLSAWILQQALEAEAAAAAADAEDDLGAWIRAQAQAALAEVAQHEHTGAEAAQHEPTGATQHEPTAPAADDDDDDLARWVRAQAEFAQQAAQDAAAPEAAPEDDELAKWIAAASAEAQDAVARAEETSRLEEERKEAERKEAERKEAERKEAERKEAERLEAERQEAERQEAARQEAERLEAERKEAERVEAARVEAERLEAERKEAERKEAERKEAERLEKERQEAEAKRVAEENEKAEEERVRVEAEARKAEEERVAEAKRQVEEAKRIEEIRRAEEIKRAEEARREELRRVEETRKTAEAARRAAEEARQEAEAAKAAAAQRAAPSPAPSLPSTASQEELRRLEEEKEALRQQREESARIRAEIAAMEDMRRMAFEEAQRAREEAAAERQRAQEELNLLREEARKAEEARLEAQRAREEAQRLREQVEQAKKLAVTAPASEPHSASQNLCADYPLSVLQSKPKFLSHARERLEQFLSPEEFYETFAMDYPAFLKEPQWRQIKLKQEVGLW